MSTVTTQLPRPLPGYAPLRPQAVMAGWVSVLVEWNRRCRERAHFSRVLPCHLADMGLSPDLVAEECAKPFWRA